MVTRTQALTKIAASTTFHMVSNVLASKTNLFCGRTPRHNLRIYSFGIHHRGSRTPERTPTNAAAPKRKSRLKKNTLLNRCQSSRGRSARESNNHIAQTPLLLKKGGQTLNLLASPGAEVENLAGSRLRKQASRSFSASAARKHRPGCDSFTDSQTHYSSLYDGLRPRRKTHARRSRAR